MKIIWNKYIPFKGYVAMTVIKWIFARDEYRKYENYYSFKEVINHENIHEQQILDWTSVKWPTWLRYVIGSLLFYSTYLLEWLLKVILSIFTLFRVRAYKSISYEQEAHLNQRDKFYLISRKRFSWTKYVFKNVLKDR